MQGRLRLVKAVPGGKYMCVSEAVLLWGYITSPYQSGHQNSTIIACCILLALKLIFSNP